MAQRNFNVSGLKIENFAGTAAVEKIVGTGAPNAQAEVLASLLGTEYTDVATSKVYIKKSNTNNNSLDWVEIVNKDYVDQQISALGVFNMYAEVASSVTTLPTATPGAPDTQDGVSITDTKKVLFFNLSTGEKNLYVYNQTSGTYTLFAQNAGANLESGDQVYIKLGTYTEQLAIYDGTNWDFFQQNSDSKIINTNNYVGKSGLGVSSPTYTSTNNINNGDNLTTAVSKLDQKVGGSVVNNDITTFTDSHTQNITALSNFLESQLKTGNLSNITTFTALDVLASVATSAKWIVEISLTSNTELKEVREVTAIRNSTQVGWTLGPKVDPSNASGTGVAYTLEVDVNSNQMRLVLTSPTAVNVKWRRLGNV